METDHYMRVFIFICWDKEGEDDKSKSQKDFSFRKKAKNKTNPKAALRLWTFYIIFMILGNSLLNSLGW